MNFAGTADHAIGKLVKFHLRALRVIRGESLSAERTTLLARDQQRAFNQRGNTLNRQRLRVKLIASFG